MNGWRSLILRIGDKSPEYGTSSDFKDHIVRFLLISFALSAQLIPQFDSRNALFLIIFQETCFGVLRRELDHSQTEILEVSTPFLMLIAASTIQMFLICFLLFINVSQFLSASNKRFLNN